MNDPRTRTTRAHQLPDRPNAPRYALSVDAWRQLNERIEDISVRVARQEGREKLQLTVISILASLQTATLGIVAKLLLGS